ncbi:hypothetical protein CN216_34595 [Sinorhizobium meliloti]|nr:hypothetical protein CN216_34595 [Sinorhizobium meliloti]
MGVYLIESDIRIFQLCLPRLDDRPSQLSVIEAQKPNGCDWRSTTTRGNGSLNADLWMNVGNWNNVGSLAFAHLRLERVPWSWSHMIQAGRVAKVPTRRPSLHLSVARLHRKCHSP